MAVQYVNGGSTFGGWGNAIGLVGTLTGQPWLSAIGAGMNVADSISSGGQQGQQGAMGNIEKMLDYMKEAGWFNPAAGNIAKQSVFNGDSTDVLQYFRGLMS